MQVLATQLQYRSTGGGALLLELGNPSALRNRYGYAALDGFVQRRRHPFGQFARTPARLPLASVTMSIFSGGARFGTRRTEGFARRSRDGIGYHDFLVDGEPMRLRCTIGYASFEHAFADTGAVLAATEDATREAHALPAGVAGFVPPELTASDNLIDELRAALAPNGEGLYLAFQPKWSRWPVATRHKFRC